MDVTLTGFSEERVIDRIAELVREQVNARIDEAVRGAIEGAIEARTKALVDDTIRPVVEAVIAEGWQPTDEWGEPKGKPTTLRARISKRVSEFLDEKGSYGDRKTAAEKIIDEAISADLRADTGAALKAAREKMNAQVDAVISAKLRETLVNALGLKAGL